MVEDGVLVKKKEGVWDYYACKQKAIEAAPYELMAADENLSQCQEMFNSIPKLEEMKAENRVRIKAAAEAIRAARAALNSCVEQKIKVQKELEGMGFFAFGKKMKAKAEIASLENQVEALRIALDCAQSDMKNIEQSVKDYETSVQNNIDEIRKDYSVAQERAKNAAEMEKMRKALPK